MKAPSCHSEPVRTPVRQSVSRSGMSGCRTAGVRTGPCYVRGRRPSCLDFSGASAVSAGVPANEPVGVFAAFQDYCLTSPAGGIMIDGINESAGRNRPGKPAVPFPNRKEMAYV